MRAIKSNVEEKVLPRAACGLYAAMAILNEETWEKVREMFPSGQDSEVAKLLQTECGNNLPFLEKETPYGLERVRFAALKLSEGSMEKLGAAVKHCQC